MCVVRRIFLQAVVRTPMRPPSRTSFRRCRFSAEQRHGGAMPRSNIAEFGHASSVGSMRPAAQKRRHNAGDADRAVVAERAAGLALVPQIALTVYAAAQQQIWDARGYLHAA